MSRKIKRTPQAALSIKGAFDEFVVAQTAKGFSESTIKNYHSHFHSISKHFDIEKPFGELTQADIDGMIVSMRESGYCITLSLHILSTGLLALSSLQGLKELW